MKTVRIRLCKSFGKKRAAHNTKCNKCKGPVAINSIIVEYTTKEGNIGYVCSKCIREAEAKQVNNDG